MPAAKKSANKNTKKRFNIGIWSKRKQAAVTVLVFAVVGGGIIVYKSFASTLVATFPSSSYVPIISPGFGTAALTNDPNSGSKTSNYTWQLGPGGAITGSDQGPYLGPGWLYQYCAHIKGVGSVIFGSHQGIRIGLTNNTAYQPYCGQIDSSGTGGISVGIISVHNSGTSTIRVQDTYVQTVGTTAGGVSPPTK